MRLKRRIPPRPRRPRRRQPSAMANVYQVVVQCHSERDQEAVFRRMKGEGRRCRVLTL